MTVPLSASAEAPGVDALPVRALPDGPDAPPRMSKAGDTIAHAVLGGADAQACAGLVREHARTFYFASWLLPPAKRRAAYALYAFCRVADDLVDRAQGRHGRPPSPAEIARQLGEYERALDLTLGAGYGDPARRLSAAHLPRAAAPHAAVFRELRHVLDRYGVPEGVLRELLAGVAMDLAPTRYATWAELVRYCEGVASSVGEMCTYVFGVTDTPAAPPGASAAAAGGLAPAHEARLRDARARALRYARTLGVAMQLTNILRDVGEDARRGRCYLPDDALAGFGLTRADVLGNQALGADERWRPFMAYMVGRARALYEAAAPGIALLAPDARRCAAACATGYAGILGAIERAGYDTVTRRAHLGHARRAAVLWQAWRWREPAPGDVCAGVGPRLYWDAVGAGLPAAVAPAAAVEHPRDLLPRDLPRDLPRPKSDRIRLA
jgi:phytoene synthase